MSDLRNFNESWLRQLDKSKLRPPKDIRNLQYKHIYYPARRLARQIWLESGEFSEFCKRCGFYQNSTIAREWDFVFSKIYNRNLRKPSAKKQVNYSIVKWLNELEI